MTKPLGRLWLSRIEDLDFAFQPIVNIHTGMCYGYEALLRNFAAAGFSSIGEVFDLAHEENVLHQVDLHLREKAIAKYARLEWSPYTKVFYNLDNRLFDSGNYQTGKTTDIINQSGLSQGNICFEISEKHQLTNSQQAVSTFCNYRSQGFRIAVDDCGSGFSGLKLLYYAEPDYIKIDRFFIQDIETNAKKRLFVSSIVEIAHMMGSSVVAEGVENSREFYGCRSIGCDLVQGYLVQKPTRDVTSLKRHYKEIELLSHTDRRYATDIDQALIKTEIRNIPSVKEDQDIISIFEKFRVDKTFSFFPVINKNREPLGVIRESALKDYAYSRYGVHLLENPSFGKSLSRFISKFPVADIYSPIEKVLKIFAQNESLEGLLIVNDMKYEGFLSAQSLLKILNEKNLTLAREQNPLSKLPGNTTIYQYISTALDDQSNPYCFIHFDFDNFKAFNDKYGFRLGDRLILRFAEILSSVDLFPNKMVGHIGGDDFFMGFITSQAADQTAANIHKIAAQFKDDASSFYDPKDNQRGFIIAKDRDGVEKRIPLLTVSASILMMPPVKHSHYTAEIIGGILADMKKEAKKSENKICIREMNPVHNRAQIRMVK